MPLEELKQEEKGKEKEPTAYVPPTICPIVFSESSVEEPMQIRVAKRFSREAKKKGSRTVILLQSFWTHNQGIPSKSTNVGHSN